MYGVLLCYLHLKNIKYLIWFSFHFKKKTIFAAWNTSKACPASFLGKRQTNLLSAN